MDTPRNAITCTRGNVTHIARWGVEGGIVTVWMGLHDPHRAHIGGMTPEVLARLLLGELMGREAQPTTC